MQSTSLKFKENAARALGDAQLQRALGNVKTGFVVKRAAARAALPEFDALRNEAAAIKNHVLAHLDIYLEEYERCVLESGGHLHWARDAAEARAIVLDLCRQAGAKTVAKGKSMVSEEIGLKPRWRRRASSRSRPILASTSSSFATRRRATSSRLPCI